MNFLAHLFLSGSNSGVQAGNLLGDEIKGRDYSYLPKNVEIGVTLHRFIDDHADTNEINLELKKLLYESFHKYSGVALDIYFDHFLAKNWNKFSGVSITEFEKIVHEGVPNYLSYFSYRSQSLFENMRKYKWLSGYGTIDGMEKTFSGMSKILPEHSGMKNGIDALEKHYNELEAGFLEYFPILSRETKEKLVDLCSI